MSKVNISVDTNKDNRKFDVTINGKKISNVSDASIYADYDENGKLLGVSVAITVRERDGDVSKVTSYYSYGSKQAHNLLNASSAIKLYDDIDEFIGVDKNDADLFADVAKFFEK